MICLCTGNHSKGSENTENARLHLSLPPPRPHSLPSPLHLCAQEEEPIDLAAIQGNVAEQLALEPPRREVQRQFRLFLSRFRPDDGAVPTSELGGSAKGAGEPFYVERIKEACAGLAESMRCDVRNGQQGGKEQVARNPI